MLSYSEARAKVVDVTTALERAPEPARALETIELACACGRVLAQSILADRDYPPFDRSTRDGFAVRASDVSTAGATLAIIGESKAGNGFSGSIAAGECIEIMTGAAVPPGADAVVMIEHTQRSDLRVTFDRATESGQNIVARGKEARAGQQLLAAGTRLGVAEMSLAAQVGCARMKVAAKPRVAVLSTGDEVVDISAAPGPLQIRNGNGIALETLVTLCGGEPLSLGNAADERGDLRQRIERGLEADLLVISGGVSKGKYDLVEAVLADLGMKTFFDAVAIRPGAPSVFGVCRGKPVLGLPGNPVSSMVTFELFAQPVIDILSATAPEPLPLLRAQLAHDLREGKPGLTRFLPARFEYAGGEPSVSALCWQGSGDVAALGQANAFLVVPPEKSEWAAGEWAMVLLRRGHGGEWC